MASKLINLIALSTLAILAASYGPASTNALSTGHIHAARHLEHAAFAKKKRESKRCKVRPTTSSSTTPKATSTTEKAEETTKAPAKTTSSKSSSSTGKSSSGNSGNSGTSNNSGSSSSGNTGGTSHPGTGKFGVKGSKICAAWGNGNDQAALKAFKTEHVVGLYDWSPNKPQGADALGYEFWPMLWGGSQDKIDAFEKAMNQEGLGTMILGFNEPNEQGQSNMDPQTAAALWKQHIEPKRSQGYKLCSPAMSSRPNGQKWMADFMKACDGCHVDYQCVHWYDIGFDKLKTYLTDYHNQLGLPILLTEFADQNFNGGAQANMDDIFAFMGQTLKFVDETDWILAACPFGIMHDLQGVNELNLLQKPSGGPTDLGYMVINNSY